MGLWGTLDAMPISELMQWLAKVNRSGTLIVEYSGVTKSIILESGMVVKVASTDPREYLGQLLVNFGLITEEQLQKAFVTQQETKVLLGKILKQGSNHQRHECAGQSMPARHGRTDIP